MDALLGGEEMSWYKDSAGQDVVRRARAACSVTANCKVWSVTSAAWKHGSAAASTGTFRRAARMRNAGVMGRALVLASKLEESGKGWLGRKATLTTVMGLDFMPVGAAGNTVARVPAARCAVLGQARDTGRATAVPTGGAAVPAAASVGDSWKVESRDAQKAVQLPARAASWMGKGGVSHRPAEGAWRS